MRAKKPVINGPVKTVATKVSTKPHSDDARPTFGLANAHSVRLASSRDSLSHDCPCGVAPTDNVRSRAVRTSRDRRVAPSKTP